jgi:hypothetical protein
MTDQSLAGAAPLDGVLAALEGSVPCGGHAGTLTFKEGQQVRDLIADLRALSTRGSISGQVQDSLRGRMGGQTRLCPTRGAAPRGHLELLRGPDLSAAGGRGNRAAMSPVWTLGAAAETAEDTVCRFPPRRRLRDDQAPILPQRTDHDILPRAMTI